MSLPINVYCDFPEGRELIAQVANVRDVKLFFEPYHNRITWNCDDLSHLPHGGWPDRDSLHNITDLED